MIFIGTRRILNRIQILLLYFYCVIILTYSFRCHPSCISTCKGQIHRRGNIALNAEDIGILSQDKPKKAFIFGLGYVGGRLADKLLSDGWTVSGTCTNVRRIEEYKKKGMKAYLFDDFSGPMFESDAVDNLRDSSHILSTIPPNVETQEDPVLRHHVNDIKQAILSGKAKWIGYLSSTGVYGDCGGGWVNEETPIRPDNVKTIARSKADSTWWFLHRRSALPVHIFRLAGIYGPGRSALDTLQKADGDFSKCSADDRAIISRIHIDDIIQLILTLMNKPMEGIRVNVADDLPASRYDALIYACKLLKYPLQPPSRSSEDESTRGGSKRVDNQLMKAILRSAGIDTLIHPDFRSGLQSIYESEFKGRKQQIQSNMDEAKQIVTSNLDAINRIENLEKIVQELQVAVEVLRADIDLRNESLT